MKKIIVLLSILSVFFAGCNDENLSLNDNNTEETYSINFHITAPLIAEGIPFKSVTNSQKITQVALSIYGEKGNLIATFLYREGSSQDVQYFEDGSAQISLSLPKGIYHFAFYTMAPVPNNPINMTVVLPVIRSIENFSDIYLLEGNYTYYESITTTVEPTNQTIEQEVTLKPMWSNLNLTIEDAQTFDAPEGTDALRFIVSPLYTGFHLDTKLATQKAPENWVSFMSKYTSNTISLEEIRANEIFTYPTYVYQTLPENGNLAIKINYMKTKNTSDTIVLETRELQIPDITIENGYNYNISGKLDVKNGQSMNISLGEFNKEDVKIEF